MKKLILLLLFAAQVASAQISGTIVNYYDENLTHISGAARSGQMYSWDPETYRLLKAIKVGGIHNWGRFLIMNDVVNSKYSHAVISFGIPAQTIPEIYSIENVDLVINCVDKPPETNNPTVDERDPDPTAFTSGASIQVYELDNDPTQILLPTWLRRINYPGNQVFWAGPGISNDAHRGPGDVVDPDVRATATGDGTVTELRFDVSSTFPTTWGSTDHEISYLLIMSTNNHLGWFDGSTGEGRPRLEIQYAFGANTATPTDTPAAADTNTPTYTPTDTPVATDTPTSTDTPTDTPAAQNTATDTPAQSNTPTNTPTWTPTGSVVPLDTNTPTPTFTAGGAVPTVVAQETPQAILRYSAGGFSQKVGAGQIGQIEGSLHVWEDLFAGGGYIQDDLIVNGRVIAYGGVLRTDQDYLVDFPWGYEAANEAHYELVSLDGFGDVGLLMRNTDGTKGFDVWTDLTRTQAYLDNRAEFGELVGRINTDAGDVNDVKEVFRWGHDYLELAGDELFIRWDKTDDRILYGGAKGVTFAMDVNNSAHPSGLNDRFGIGTERPQAQLHIVDENNDVAGLPGDLDDRGAIIEHSSNPRLTFLAGTTATSGGITWQDSDSTTIGGEASIVYNHNSDHMLMLADNQTFAIGIADKLAVGDIGTTEPVSMFHVIDENATSAEIRLTDSNTLHTASDGSTIGVDASLNLKIRNHETSKDIIIEDDGGTDIIYVDSSADAVVIGGQDTSADADLDVSVSGVATMRLHASSGGDWEWEAYSDNNLYIENEANEGDIHWRTNAKAAAMCMDMSAKTLMVGTGASGGSAMTGGLHITNGDGGTEAGDFTFEDNSALTGYFLATNAANIDLNFGDTDDSTEGLIRYGNGTDTFQIGTDSTVHWNFTEDGSFEMHDNDEPDKPASLVGVLWVSTGTGVGDQGDLMYGYYNGADYKYVTVADYSAGTTWP